MLWQALHIKNIRTHKHTHDFETFHWNSTSIHTIVTQPRRKSLIQQMLQDKIDITYSRSSVLLSVCHRNPFSHGKKKIKLNEISRRFFSTNMMQMRCCSVIVANQQCIPWKKRKKNTHTHNAHSINIHASDQSNNFHKIYHITFLYIIFSVLVYGYTYIPSAWRWATEKWWTTESVSEK